MTWDRFHFACRRQLRAPQADFADTLRYFRSDQDADLIGPPPSPKALPERIMARLAALPDEQRNRAIALYAQMDFTGAAPLPRKVLRSVAYLIILSLVFGGMTSVYALFVMPSIAPLFTDIGATPPGYGVFGLPTLPLLLTVAIAPIAGLTLYALHRCCTLDLSDPGSGLIRVLPPFIRRRYANIVHLATYPVSLSPADNPLASRLDALAGEGIDLADELPRMIQHQWTGFAQGAQRYLNVLLAAAAVIILLTISFYVSSAYAPLFIMESLV